MDRVVEAQDSAGSVGTRPGFESAGDFIDIVKLGWGTAAITKKLATKVARIRDHHEASVSPGGLRADTLISSLGHHVGPVV